MAGKKTSVAKIEEVRRLLGLGLTERKIARALGVSRNTVAKVRAGEAAPVDASAATGPEWVERVDWERLNRECRSGSASLYVIWEELSESGAVPVLYPGFWKHYKKRFPEHRISMHRVFEPGARIEIDYCDGIEIYDPLTGEIKKTQLFVGVLCCSRYVYAEFTHTQKSQDFLSSHVRMFEAFQGVAQVLSPDNLKSAVSKAHRYDPELNPAYTRLAEHYGVGIVPARVRAPKDKAIVERTVQIFQRWFYARMRHRTFTSLTELNKVLREYIKIFHAKKHRIFGKSRQEMFESEKNSLRPLPEHPYQVATHKVAKLHPDCHLVFDGNFYSAPERYRGHALDVWATESLVEISKNGELLAAHQRSRTQRRYVTQKSHYPEAMRAYADTTVQQLLKLARRIGPHTFELANELLSGETPLRHLRRVQGIIRLGLQYDHQKLEEACSTANQLGQQTYLFVERRLKLRLKQREKEQPISRQPNTHLRGSSLFT
jgi:transposase